MHYAVIYIDPTGPAPFGFTQAAGMPGDIKFDFKTQGNAAYTDISNMFPQLVMRPFTRPDIHAYDIDVNDPTGAAGIARIPGVVMNDRFNVELYTRESLYEGPTRMIAYGRIDLNGWGYMRSGPLGPASFPTGPSGPAGLKGETGDQGPQGDAGLRGSRWYTNTGVPTSHYVPDDRVPGDMYLDETNGDVWRWDGVAWTAFKGV